MNKAKARNNKQAATERGALVGIIRLPIKSSPLTSKLLIPIVYITALNEIPERLENESLNTYKIINRNAREQKDIDTENILHIYIICDRRSVDVTRNRMICL